jgi:hypothetical protein
MLLDEAIADRAADMVQALDEAALLKPSQGPDMADCSLRVVVSVKRHGAPQVSSLEPAAYFKIACCRPLTLSLIFTPHLRSLP